MRRILITSLLTLTACTTWVPTRSVLQSKELERTAVTGPQLEERTQSKAKLTTKSEMEVDDDGKLVSKDRGTGEASSLKTVRCVQKFKVLREEEYRIDHQLRGAAADYVGGGAAILGGIIVMAAGFSSSASGNSNLGLVILGSSLVLGGGGLIGHAGAVSGKKPEPEEGVEDVTDLVFVETTGCPGFSEPKSNADDSTKSVRERLEELERLHEDGLISDLEYEAKREALLDQM